MRNHCVLYPIGYEVSQKTISNLNRLVSLHSRHFPPDSYSPVSLRRFARLEANFIVRSDDWKARCACAEAYFRDDTNSPLQCPNSCYLGSGRVKKVQRLKNVHRYLRYLNLHQVMWYHFLHQGKNLCQNPFSH